MGSSETARNRHSAPAAVDDMRWTWLLKRLLPSYSPQRRTIVTCVVAGGRLAGRGAEECRIDDELPDVVDRRHRDEPLQRREIVFEQGNDGGWEQTEYPRVARDRDIQLALAERQPHRPERAVRGEAHGTVSQLGR